MIFVERYADLYHESGASLREDYKSKRKTLSQNTAQKTPPRSVANRTQEGCLYGRRGGALCYIEVLCVLWQTVTQRRFGRWLFQVEAVAGRGEAVAVTGG